MLAPPGIGPAAIRRRQRQPARYCKKLLWQLLDFLVARRQAGLVARMDLTRKS